MANMIPISTVTVGSGNSASIDFTSIPADYTDLCVKFSGNGSISNSVLRIQFNSSTSGYTARLLRGSGTAANSYTQADFGTNGIYGTYFSGSGAIPTNQEFYIPSYLSSNYKSVSVDAVEEGNNTTFYMMLTAGLWSSTSAITSISLSGDSGNLLQYSTATLYGIRKY
jgi:hypothetical protein